MPRHPYHAHEAPLGPRYTVYNRRQMACCFDATLTTDGSWKLHRSMGVLHTDECPLEFRGPDAERLLNRLFTKDISKLPVVVPATNEPSRIGAIDLGVVDIERPRDEPIQARSLAQEITFQIPAAFRHS